MGGAVIVLRIQMDIEEKISILEEGPDEIVTHDELRTLPETKKSPRAYIGLEPSVSCTRVRVYRLRRN